jgi:hypothetical protein
MDKRNHQHALKHKCGEQGGIVSFSLRQQLHSQFGHFVLTFETATFSETGFSIANAGGFKLGREGGGGMGFSSENPSNTIANAAAMYGCLAVK